MLVKSRCLGIIASVLVGLIVQTAIGGSPGCEECPYECNFVLEFMHIQDFSNSFQDDKEHLEVKLVELLELIGDVFPGSLTGLATFTDKPLQPFGFPNNNWFSGDWCLNVSSVISAADPQVVVDEMFNAPLGGGLDFPENQLGAIHDVARNDGLVGWTNRQYDENGMPVIRVLSVSTDAMYHIAGDGANSIWGLYPNDGDSLTVCDEEDYPTIAQVRQALLDRHVYLIFLIGNATEDDVKPVYDELLDVLDVPGAVYRIREDSSNIVEVMQDAFDDMAELVCSIPTLDVVLTHDVTYSYKNDMPNLHDEVFEVAKASQSEYICPFFGLTTFSDKPFRPFGQLFSGDHCYQLRHNMTAYPEELQVVADTILTTSGRDWRESQLDGIMSTCLDPNMNWRTGDKWNGFEVLRVVAMATDAGYHREGDAAAAGLELLPHSGGMVNCTTEDYPSVEQVAEVLLQEDIHPVFIANGDIVFIYHDLMDQLEDYGVVGEVVELGDLGSISDAVKVGVESVRRKVAVLKEFGLYPPIHRR